MYAQSVRMGRILGIPFGVNYSWFIIFVLITVCLQTFVDNLGSELRETCRYSRVDGC